QAVARRRRRTRADRTPTRSRHDYRRKRRGGHRCCAAPRQRVQSRSRAPNRRARTAKRRSDRMNADDRFNETTFKIIGRPIAVVVADTFERATAAASRVRVAYSAQAPVLDFAVARSTPHAPATKGSTPPEVSWGDFSAGLAAAEVRIDAVYSTPMEHHNPM